jgi:UDP-N-acetylglucosamine 2-epimerase (non-hydrolysing)
MTSAAGGAQQPTVTAVVGARPNFVKMAPVVQGLLDGGRVRVRVLHTGQHYDPALSDSFLAQLGMPAPDENLRAGSGSHAEQVAKVLVGVEASLQRRRSDALVVAGDVNSTFAAGLAAAKLGVPVVHVESGLRSGDWSMPEEINRVLTDRLSDLLLCTSADAVDNLAGEGIAGERVSLVGNTMIDSLRRLGARAAREPSLSRLDLQPRGFVLVTLHRPDLVDDDDRLAGVLGVLEQLAAEIPVVFPVHPRTRERIARLGTPSTRAVRLLEALSYLEFIPLQSAARLIVTDSGGVQEESSALGVPCLTYRTTTERPVTVELGTNRLIGTEPADLAIACRAELARHPDFAPAEIPLWDGQAGPRAARAIEELVARRSWTR